MKARGMIVWTLLTALLCGSAQAAGAGKYELEELAMELTVPEGLYVLERDNLDQDEDMEKLGLSPEQMAQSMEAQNIYLEILPETLDWELSVVMVADENSQDLHDFNLYDDSSMERLLDGMEAEYAKTGLEVENWSVYQGEQARFFVIDTRQSQGQVEIVRRQYYTVYNAQFINLTLTSYTGEYTQEMEQIQKDVADSVYFTQTVPPSEEALTLAESFSQREDKPEGEPSMPWTILRACLKGAGVGVIVYLVWVILRRLWKDVKKPAKSAPELELSEEDLLEEDQLEELPEEEFSEPEQELPELTGDGSALPEEEEKGEDGL